MTNLLVFSQERKEEGRKKRKNNISYNYSLFGNWTPTPGVGPGYHPRQGCVLAVGQREQTKEPSGSLESPFLFRLAISFHHSMEIT